MKHKKATLKNYLRTVQDGPAAKRALAVLLLEASGDVGLTGYTPKHAERLRRDFKQHGTTTFEDKRKSNRERVLTKSERERVVAILEGHRPSDVIPGCPTSTGQLTGWDDTLLKKQANSTNLKPATTSCFVKPNCPSTCPASATRRPTKRKRGLGQTTKRWPFPAHACLERCFISHPTPQSLIPKNTSRKPGEKPLPTTNTLPTLSKPLKTLPATLRAEFFVTVYAGCARRVRRKFKCFVYRLCLKTPGGSGCCQE